MTVALAAVLVGSIGPWPISWLSRKGASPRLAVASQIACLLLSWSGTLVLVADVAAPRTGVIRACATVVAAILRGDASFASIAAAFVYSAVLGRTLLCLARASSRSRKTVRSILSIAERHGPAWVVQTAPSVGFTAGLVRPLVVLSAEHAKYLSAETKHVVLAHERAHARGRHSALDLLTRVLAAGLAPWPAAKLATAEVRRNIEACADDRAARSFGGTVVARAIGEVALMPALEPAPGTLGATQDPVWRVRRLLEPQAVPRWREMSASAAAGSSLVVGAQGAAHALMGSHLLPIAGMCPL